MVLALLAILFVTLLLLRMPVAFALGVSSLVGIIVSPTAKLIAVPTKMIESVDSFVLLAVPLFILAGSLMETGGIAARLVNLATVLVGWIRGGLGMVVIVGEMFFSGISGSTVADVSAMASMLLPAMRRAGYTMAHSVAIVSAASAMGILIPPCILMVVLGAMLQVSVAHLFFAGFLPAFVLASFIMLLLAYEARKLNLPAGKRPSPKRFAFAWLDALIPLGMPVIIFGGILGGVFSPTEAAGVAVAYAAVVGLLIYREISLQRLYHTAVEAGIITGLVLILVQMASGYGYLMALERVPLLLSNLIFSISDDPVFFLMVSNFIFIVIASFLEGLPAMVIFIPILLPIADQLGIDLIHWGITVIAAMGISMFIPPSGVGLMVACSVAKISMGQAWKPLRTYILVLILGLIVVTLVPWFSTIVPDLMGR